MGQEDALHCTLSGPELMQRLADWKELGSNALTREVRTSGVVTTFPRRAEIAEQLQALIAAEAGCCTFMEFEVKEEPDQIVVELRVPDEMAPMLSMMLGAVSQAEA